MAQQHGLEGIPDLHRPGIGMNNRCGGLCFLDINWPPIPTKDVTANEGSRVSITFPSIPRGAQESPQRLQEELRRTIQIPLVGYNIRWPALFKHPQRKSFRRPNVKNAATGRLPSSHDLVGPVVVGQKAGGDPLNFVVFQELAPAQMARSNQSLEAARTNSDALFV